MQLRCDALPREEDLADLDRVLNQRHCPCLPLLNCLRERRFPPAVDRRKISACLVEEELENLLVFIECSEVHWRAVVVVSRVDQSNTIEANKTSHCINVVVLNLIEELIHVVFHVAPTVLSKVAFVNSGDAW